MSLGKAPCAICGKWLSPKALLYHRCGKWQAIPMPDGATNEVYALVTEDLTVEEQNALGEYVAWMRERSS